MPLATDRPVVLADDFTDDTVAGAHTTRGRLIDAAAVDVVLPRAWTAARVNGQPLAADANGRLHVALAGAVQRAQALEMSHAGGPFQPFDPSRIEGGLWTVRFHLPTLPRGEHRLVLAGLGVDDLELRIGGRSRQSPPTRIARS